METRSRQVSEVQTENQDEEPNGSLREFVPAWVSVPDGLGDFSSCWCWGFHSQPSLELTEHDPEKRKYSSSSSCGGKKKCLVDVRGQRRRGRRASLNTQNFKSSKKVSNSSRGPWKHHSEQPGTGPAHSDGPVRIWLKQHESIHPAWYQHITLMEVECCVEELLGKRWAP